MELSAADRDMIGRTIRDVERRTTGEIVCVLARSSTAAPALPAMLAAAIALAVPWLLMALTPWSLREILTVQVVAFVAMVLVLSLPRVQMALVPRAAQRAAAHRAALQQFVARGIARTEGRTGILIFVSLAERYARIVADDRVSALVPQAEWQAAVDALVSHMRRGEMGQGFVAAIERCGAVLATHFPASGENRNELPDRIFLI